jgi:septal ring factor EnvC (AmiA/AmiB activator)
MDASVILSSLLTAAIIGIFSAYFYSKRQKKIKAESRQREEEVREEMSSLRAKAEGLRQELRSSSAALHESEMRIQELTQALSDPAKVFLDHLKDVRERSDQLSHGLGAAVSRANLYQFCIRVS